MRALEAITKVELQLIELIAEREVRRDNAIKLELCTAEIHAKDVAKAEEALEALTNLEHAIFKAGLAQTDLKDFKQLKPKTDLERMIEDLEGSL